MSDLIDRVSNLSQRQHHALAKLLADAGSVAGNASASRQQLVAYVVGASGVVDEAELGEWLGTSLPNYMIPDAIIPLDELPRRPNGKVDTSALPAPPRTGSATDEVVAPRNEIEQTLADIWSELLGLNAVSVHDDFFEVGGDSIISIQVMSRARQAGVLLQPADFAAYSTIAELANAAKPIEQLDTVLSEQDATPSEQQYVFRLDGIGNTIQYVEIDFVSGATPKLGTTRTVRFEKDYKRETRLEELATDYLERVRDLQPEGPYMFVSMDCGTHVTYEVAQQLTRNGEIVSFFGVVEAAPPLVATSVVSKYLKKGLRYLGRFDVRGLVAGLRLTRQRGLALKPMTSPDGEVLPFNHGLTINNYLPTPYPGRITLFHSTDFHQNQNGKQNIRDWTRLVPTGLNIAIVEATYPLDVFAPPYDQQLVTRLVAEQRVTEVRRNQVDDVLDSEKGDRL